MGLLPQPRVLSVHGALAKFSKESRVPWGTRVGDRQRTPWYPTRRLAGVPCEYWGVLSEAAAPGKCRQKRERRSQEPSPIQLVWSWSERERHIGAHEKEPLRRERLIAVGFSHLHGHPATIHQHITQQRSVQAVGELEAHTRLGRPSCDREGQSLAGRDRNGFNGGASRKRRGAPPVGSTPHTVKRTPC